MTMAKTRIAGGLEAEAVRSFCLLIFFSLAAFVESAIGEDGLCNIFTYAPFTIGYAPYMHRHAVIASHF
jgi:hypothetical protein